MGCLFGKNIIRHAYILTLEKYMQLRELLLCWKPGVMPLHEELKAWSDAKMSFRSWPDAFDLKSLIMLFAHVLCSVHCA